jgi:naphthalene 1,2-dioxygenase ferredoxin component
MSTEELSFVCDDKDVAENDMKLVELSDGKQIALYKVGGHIYATDALCTHGNALLTDGMLEGFEVVCPFHAGKFDVRTGEVTAYPATTPVSCYRVAILGGRVGVAATKRTGGL